MREFLTLGEATCEGGAREAEGKQWDAYLDTWDIPHDAFEIVQDGDRGRGTRVKTR